MEVALEEAALVEVTSWRSLPEVEAAVVCLIMEVGGCWLPCGCGLRTRDVRLCEAGGRICDERTLLIRGLPIAKADGLVAQPSCESLKKKATKLCASECRQKGCVHPRNRTRFYHSGARVLIMALRE